MWNHHCPWQVNKSCGFCGYQLQVFSSRQLWYWVHVPMNKNFLSIHESYPQKKFENHHPDTFITTQEHWLLWNGMIPLHEKIHFIFSMTEIKCKLVKFNKCYVKRILLFIVIDLNRKKWWSINEVSTVWLELFTCSYSCTDNNSVYHLKIMNGTSRSIYNTCLFIIHVAAKMRKYFLYC